MKRKCFRVVILTVLGFALSGASGCPNQFSNFTDYTTEDALYTQAQLYLNSRDYDNAITTLNKLSSGYRAKRHVRFVAASAYAGKCGLSIFSLIESLGNLGSQRLFPFTLSTFKQLTVTNAQACRSAESEIRSVSDNPSVRTTDENLLLVLSSLVKIGAIFAATIDDDDDGTLDAAHNGTDHCHATNMLTDSEVDELITGMSNIISGLENIGPAVDPSQLSVLGDACEAIPAPYEAYRPCGTPDASSITAEQRKGMRTLFGTNTGIGLGNCSGDIATCGCFP